jgi:HK97 family phage major capsid protein
MNIKTIKKNTPLVTKSMKVGADELDERIKAAVKAAMEEGVDNTAEGDIRSLIEEVFAEVIEKRKARKEAGEDLDEEGLVKELMEAASIALEGENPEDGEDGVAEDEKTKASGDSEKAADDKQKSAQHSRQTKSRRTVAAPVQRKYSDIYVPHSGGSFQKEQKKLPPEIALARAVKCLDVFQAGSARKDPDRAAYLAKSIYGDERMEREFKALSATVPSTGGYLIPEVYLDEIIELLYAKTVIFELGARKVPMANGNLNVPKITSGARATWGGEARKISKSQPAFGNIKLSAKRLESIVPQTRELLMSTNYSADAIFAQDLTRRMELGLDWGALFGTGGEFQPLGVQNTKGILTIDAKTIANASLADASGKITADFPVYVRSTVLAKNVDDLALGWTFNSLMEGYFMNMKTTTGTYIYREGVGANHFGMAAAMAVFVLVITVIAAWPYVRSLMKEEAV